MAIFRSLHGQMREETSTLDAEIRKQSREGLLPALCPLGKVKPISACLVVAQLDEFGCMLEFHLRLPDDGQALMVEQE